MRAHYRLACRTAHNIHHCLFSDSAYNSQIDLDTITTLISPHIQKIPAVL